MTRIEVLALVLSLLILVVTLLLPARAGSGCGVMTKDATQVKQIHAAWTTFSRDFDGVFPMPDPENAKANTSAAMYSMCIMMNYFTPQILVSPTEPSAYVAIKDDYGWELYDAAENVSSWDGDPDGSPPPNAPPGYVPFAVNLSSNNPYTGGPICNTSYAHNPLCGERMTRQWKDTLNAGWAVVGTRGVICGNDRDKAVYEASRTLKFFGSNRRWVGNVAFNDNHVETLDTFVPEGLDFRDANGAFVPDNLFRNDAEDGDCGSGLGIDVFLTLVSEITDGETCRITTEWD